MSIGRWLVETSTRVACYTGRGRRIRPHCPAGPVKVNLGSGLAVAPGWINVDASLNSLVAAWPRPVHRFLYRFSGSREYYSFQEYHSILRGHRFLLHDLAHGIPFPDESVDVVYSSHFLEHLPRNRAVELAREIHRVLKRGGLARIAVPDLAFAVALYARGEREGMLDTYFFVDVGDSAMSHHRYMYDFELLEALLREAGFAWILRRAYREGEAPDLDLLDNRPEDTLFVEATRS